MFRFLLKSAIVALVFFVGVILGMQKANEGLVNMRGYEDPLLYDAVSIEEEDGEAKAKLMGEEIASHDLEEKRRQMEEIKAFNFLSNIGKKIGEGTRGVVDHILDSAF
ncbi:MAG: DUF3679 domain-containing protein [Bacillus sp. (in: firmicutes)]